MCTLALPALGLAVTHTFERCILASDNYANIMNQSVVLLTYLTAILITNSRDEGSAGVLSMSMLAVQGVMFLFLIYISTVKLTVGAGGLKESKEAVLSEMALTMEDGMSEAMLRELFRVFDLDGDELIEPAELKTMLGWLGESLTDEELECLTVIAGDPPLPSEDEHVHPTYSGTAAAAESCALNSSHRVSMITFWPVADEAAS